MRKRSNRVALTILGATAFTLAGCQHEKVEAEAFPDLQSCEAAASAGAGGPDAADCAAAFAEAQKLHVESAPRYDSLQLCEEQHGAGACGSEADAVGNQSGGSGSIFMPLLAGYLIGNMLGRGGVGAQPLYKTSNGRFANATGSQVYGSNRGRATLGANHFARPPSTLGKAPMTRASVASRGGFGKTVGSRGGFGG
ncbi:hypothetical protein BV394_12395 [Brevirhabdus pacifica]|uniref:Uncharacterized protein n=1 Tax=Brevirhabdus pacifica TaxID=1267768 RepID=A0A1U7DKM6_9RHOB|nr:DUF1190 domain-containing protein [Brevirhabdus pacifica]APX90428.1 hypothetical protein BV394_12395 [Brevirhabdus pacifica]OWU78552.1 hypothetical protein ATO5_07070 [Loktanella sp. 22II-4b]PJJ85475.1 uncharacterized protein YgiB involved in biofilm formation [Brevirhabdus pacifica]